MSSEIKDRMQQRVTRAIEHLGVGLAGVRTGRASLLLFDAVRVDYYGTMTPLKQIATLSLPDSRTVVIQPWDASQMAAIEKGILTAGIGVTPINDGKVVRITIPALTEERRRDMVKLIGRMGEEGRVAVRNARRETNDEIKALQKTGDLAEDAAHKQQDEIQKMTDHGIVQVEEMLKRKEKEVMEV